MATATTKKKSPSSELEELQATRDRTYSAVQDLKRERQAWDQETESLRAAYSAFVAARPEDHADAAHNPKPGTPSAEKRDELKARIAAGNPHEEALDAAVATFHAADEELNHFLTTRLLDLLDEQTPAVRALEAKRAEAFESLAEVASEYADLEAQARDWIIRTPRLNGQSLKADSRPAQWAELARDNRDAPLSAPGLRADAEWTITNG